MNKAEQFNMIIVGTGGQGQITLLQLIAQAALEEGYDIKTSELHGLSQRGGSVEVHLRFGKKINSPLISPGKADLILGLEMQETLRAVPYSNPRTNFLISKYIMPIPLQKPVSEKQILNALNQVSKNISLIPAADICQKELGTNVTAGVFLVSLAAFKNLIPIKPVSVSKALKQILPEKYLDLNLKTFELARQNFSKI